MTAIPNIGATSRAVPGTNTISIRTIRAASKILIGTVSVTYKTKSSSLPKTSSKAFLPGYILTTGVPSTVTVYDAVTFFSDALKSDLPSFTLVSLHASKDLYR